jgi:hypothetical protein
MLTSDDDDSLWLEELVGFKLSDVAGYLNGELASKRR